MLVMALLLMIVSAPVFASKIFAVPTGDILKPETLEVDYAFVNGYNTLNLNYGIYSGWNIGISQGFGSGGTSLAGNLKIAILEETNTVPALAIGGTLAAGGGGEVYAAVSKQLGTPVLRGHAGIGVGSNIRPMVGVTAIINPVQAKVGSRLSAPTTAVFLEHDGGSVNGGIIANFHPNFKAKLGLATSSGLLFGLNYKISF